MSMKIWIDAGHGRDLKGVNDPGAVHPSGRTEADDNLRYAKELEKQFKAKGFEVIMTRTREDENPSINERCALERKTGCVLALSCHRNAAGPAANGFECWVHSRAPESFIAWGKGIAAAVAPLGLRTRGVYRGAPGYPDFGVNRLTNSPSMLLELGFVTSEADNAVFDAKLEKLCGAIVDGCIRFLRERGKMI